MPLDHYVSQVHLRNFYSPALGERMYAIRKSDMHTFQCRSEDVCRTKDGSTNKYLAEPRVIEEFLETIEPRYNVALAKLRSGTIDHETVYVIAGFIGYVAACSPAGMRLGAGPLRGLLEVTANTLDKRGSFPKAPPGLGGKSVTELLADGTIAFEVDGKYPQAIGITNVISFIKTFGNSKWDILSNGETTSPFFTSDFPLAIEQTPDLRVTNRIVPLSPDLAVRIRPDPAAKKSDGFAFSRFASRYVTIGGASVRSINRLIVQSAESVVFYRDDAPWVSKFVERNRRYRIEPMVQKIPTHNGHLVWSRLLLAEQKAA